MSGVKVRVSLQHRLLVLWHAVLLRALLPLTVPGTELLFRADGRPPTERKRRRLDARITATVRAEDVARVRPELREALQLVLAPSEHWTLSELLVEEQAPLTPSPTSPEGP